MKVKKAALIPVLAVAAWTVAGTENEVSHPQSRAAPGPVKGTHGTESIRYTAVTKNGKRVPLGETVRTFVPDRKTFNAQVEDSRRRRQSIPGQSARMVEFDTYTDGRRPTVRKIYPSDYAGRAADRADDQE